MHSLTPKTIAAPRATRLLPNLPMAALLLGIALPAAALPTPAYATLQVLPGSYSAVLHLQAQRWDLLDPNGAALQISVSDCGAESTLPTGLWLLTRDHSGAPILLAPSATELPAGHSGAVSIGACTDAATPHTLRLPPALLQALESHASAILVQN